MTLRIKKIIAREFLVLLLTIAITILAFLSIYPYNSFRKYQINNLSDQVLINNKTFDSLTLPLKAKREKQLWFHNEYIEYNSRHVPVWLLIADKNGLPIFGKNENLQEFDNSNTTSRKDTVLLEYDLTKDFSGFGKHFGFDTPEEFKEFIRKYTITENDLEKNKEAQKINNQTILLTHQKDIYLSKIISPNDQIHFAFIAFLIFVCILFLLRYVYYGFKWSIKTIKQKTE